MGTVARGGPSSLPSMDGPQKPGIPTDSQVTQFPTSTMGIVLLSVQLPPRLSAWVRRMLSQMPSPDTSRFQPKMLSQTPSWDLRSSSTPLRWRSKESSGKPKGTMLHPAIAPDGLSVPATAWSQVLQWGHSGHPGTGRTLSFIQRKFWWPEMREDVQNFVSACSVCTQAKVTAASSATHFGAP